MKIELYGMSDVGKARSLNEDSYRISGFENSAPPGYCILADGMGGHNAGEVASSKAINFIDEVLKDSLGCADNEIPPALERAMEHANHEIYELSVHTPGQHGMGTTAVAAYLTENTAYVANVGDSRAYAVRDDEICRITVDHSVVEELIATGNITREEAFHHPQKNIITRAVGTEPEVKTDIYEYSYLPDDMMLLCSDGLTEMVREEEIFRIMKSGLSVRETAEQLVKAALDQGGYDNVTVICIRFVNE